MSHQWSAAISLVKEPPTMTSAILRHIVDRLPATDAADAELLRRFAQQKEEPAFAEILRRHGPLVLGVCRRVLGDVHAADDAFQATFVQLARQAAQLRCDGSLAGWLHTVARRVALAARRGEQRRRRREANFTQPKPAEDMTWRELREVLDAELARLPDEYRLPLILCYLEDCPQSEAAERLGWPLPTLRGRLERGRQKLRTRLTRYGLPLAAPLILLGGDGVAAELRDATLRAVFEREPLSPAIALLAAVGPPVARWKFALAASVMLVVLGGSVAGFVGTTPKPPPAEEPAKPQAAAPVKGVDSLGDPLPEGAIMRLGTRRFRIDTYPRQYQSLPDGKSFLTVHGGQEVRWMDAETGKITNSFSLPHPIIGISPDGHYALITNQFIFYTGLRRPGTIEQQDWHLVMYDLKTRKPVWQKSEKLQQHEWPQIDRAAFSTDNKWIMTQGASGGLAPQVFDAADGKELWKGQAGGGFRLLGFADGGNAAVYYNGADVYVFDRATGAQFRCFTPMTRESARSHTLSPDGAYLFVGGAGKAVRVFETMTGKEREPLGGHADWTACASACSADGRTVATGSKSPIRIWDWPSGKLRRTIDVIPGDMYHIGLSPDGKRLEVIGWFDCAIVTYDVETGQRRPQAVDAHTGSVEGVAVLPDGKLVTVGRDRSARTWELKDGTTVAEVHLKEFAAEKPFAVSADGKRLAIAKFQEGVVQIIERDTGKVLQTLTSAERAFDGLAASPDLRFVAAVTAQQSRIIVWSTETGQPVLGTELGGHQNSTTVTFSPDGRVLVASTPGNVRFWDTATWKERLSLNAYAQNGLAFSADGRMLATASVEGVKIWEVATLQQRAYIRPMKGYPSGSLMFSPSGRYLAWTADRTKILVYDVRTGEELKPFTGHDAPITSLSFTGERLASASEDSTILIWDMKK
jgi:RNA polymerase sigma factor (sigma-70 family)